MDERQQTYDRLSAVFARLEARFFAGDEWVKSDDVLTMLIDEFFTERRGSSQMENRREVDEWQGAE